MIWPANASVVQPNADLPHDIKIDYLEARSILYQSPRGAAALMRLAIQKLCKELGEIGENPNADIAALVRRGLLPHVQQALDAVRVIGNNAVHPGQLDLRDDVKTAAVLFMLINLIADQMISGPKQAEAIYSTLPEDTRAAIEKRDAK